MNEQEILARWEADKPLYRAWAKLIDQEIERRLVSAIAPTPLDYFLKVPMVPRLKGDTSLIDKALYRSKPYKNPYEDITESALQNSASPHKHWVCAVSPTAPSPENQFTSH